MGLGVSVTEDDADHMPVIVITVTMLPLECVWVPGTFGDVALRILSTAQQGRCVHPIYR